MRRGFHVKMATFDTFLIRLASLKRTRSLRDGELNYFYSLENDNFAFFRTHPEFSRLGGSGTPIPFAIKP